MTWFSIPNSFSGGTKAKAAEVNANFSEIADALNGLFDLGTVRATGKITLEGDLQDVPGAELEITPTISSKLLIWAVWEVQIEKSVSPREASGYVVVDSNNLSPNANARTDVDGGAELDLRLPISQFYVVDLSVATHTVKLRARGQGQCNADATGFLYLLIPDPEP